MGPDPPKSVSVDAPEPRVASRGPPTSASDDDDLPHRPQHPMQIIGLLDAATG